MKTIIFLLLMLVSRQLIAQGKIEVTIRNIQPATGNIRVGLFNNEDDFLKNAVQGKVVKASATEVRVVFDNLAKGEYAVSIIHDENENGELDTNAIGIPKEGFAFGNNAMGTFGPPSFEKAKVQVENNTVTQEISVKYM
jgi:uncharacterized protein (DUF2141 family)